MGQILVIPTAAIVTFGEIQDRRILVVPEHVIDQHAFACDEGFAKAELTGGIRGQAKMYRRNPDGRWVKDPNDTTLCCLGDNDWVVIVGRLEQ
jgi:hypothetical protein